MFWIIWHTTSQKIWNFACFTEEDTLHFMINWHMPPNKDNKDNNVSFGEKVKSSMASLVKNSSKLSWSGSRELHPWYYWGPRWKGRIKFKISWKGGKSISVEFVSFLSNPDHFHLTQKWGLTFQRVNSSHTGFYQCQVSIHHWKTTQCFTSARYFLKTL